MFNGEGDLLPGLVCDVYSGLAVVQFDGTGPSEFWPKEDLADWILENTNCETVYLKPRKDPEYDLKIWGKETDLKHVLVKENSANFEVNVADGQKTGFFLDQRDNRNYIRNLSKNLSVLNLFSYSGGFSIYAGLGGAKAVTSVDLSKGAIELCEKNWAHNGLANSSHTGICGDVFDFLEGEKEKFEVVICDPPSMAKSEKTKDRAFQKYIDTFSLAAKRVKSGGHLVLSSCSSHISFEDFEEIIVQSLSASRRTGQILRVSGQGHDHPYPSSCPELRYLKFFDLILD